MPVAVVFLLLAVALFVDILGIPRTVKLEAGAALPSAAEISGRDDARYVDEELIDVSAVGEYDVVIEYGKKSTMRIKLKVEDTKAPIGTVKPLTVHHASTDLPTAADFFSEIYDASEYEAKFAQPLEITGMGEQAVNIVLEDVYGNKVNYKTTVSVINDTEPPRIFAEEIVAYVGEVIPYNKLIVVEDNCFGWKLEYKEVDTTKEGMYIVNCIATDAAGHKVEAMIPVEIRENLDSVIAKIAADEGMTKELSKEELCKRIYKYVNDPGASKNSARFRYEGHSNTDRTDWKAEAQLTLRDGKGDCYSYFALSKAFFEYFGIENRDVERSKGITTDTHFWSMVNIGSAENPRWYFFDATRYAGKFELGGDNGCLLTAAQLESYEPSNSAYKGKYYVFDASKYPKAQTQIINDKYSFK